MNKSYLILFGFLLPFTVWAEEKKPNIILIMADDMGWGDVGFNGNKVIKTPHLDKLSASGLKLNNFFSGSSVCSPTRASCLTGRSPYRYGVWKANVARLPVEEITIPQMLKKAGYATGHFGKWHLGSPHPDYKGKGSEDKAYPQWFGYDEHFVTHHSVPTWNPYGEKGEDAASIENPYYHNSERVTTNVAGDDTRIILASMLCAYPHSSTTDRLF
jgi:arylsulfatase A-like enzyme